MNYRLEGLKSIAEKMEADSYYQPSLACADGKIINLSNRDIDTLIALYDESKEEKMRAEARADIIEHLDGYTGYYCDFHSDVFNSDYYIIGTYQAKQALAAYDVFEAIDKVQEYEKGNFGEVYTDLSDPEKLVNMLYYIIGEEELFSMMDGIDAWDDNWNSPADEESNAAILKALAEKGIEQ